MKHRLSVSSVICRPPKSLTNKLAPKTKLLKNVNINPVVNDVPSTTETLKSGRRRLDTSDYIRRRFLYDNAFEKLLQTRSPKTCQQGISHGRRLRNSPLALIAASSANLQQKRKKTFTELSSFNQLKCGRRLKMPQTSIFNLMGPIKPLGNQAPLDGDSSTDGHVSEGYSNQIIAGRSNHRWRTKFDRSRLLKSNFSKMRKKSSCNYGNLQNRCDCASEIPAFFLNVETKSRGPVILSKRSRHRLVPRLSTSKSDLIKQVTEYPDFFLSDEVRCPFPLNHVPVIEAGREASDVEWSGHVGRSASPISIDPVKHSGIEMEDFAGDLLPQTCATVGCPPASGSSRRKSPIRPMQVLRSEPIMYPTGHGDSTGINATGGTLMHKKQLISPFSQPADNDAVATGLVDLCAAAGLDSTYTIQPQSPHISAEAAEFDKQSPIISNVPQYPLIESSFVSYLSGGRIFVAGGAQIPITGYTVASPTPVSRIVVAPGRHNYGQLPHSTAFIKSSISTSSSNSSANSNTRWRPTILKRGANPTSSLSLDPVPKMPVAFALPRLSPPFMRTALRGVQASPLVTSVQPVRPVVYTIVTAASSGQSNAITVTPSSAANSSKLQTASSRLFGTKRTMGIPSTVMPLPLSSNPTLISGLSTSSVVSSSQKLVRYAFVQGVNGEQKYTPIGGNTNRGVTDYKRPLQSIDEVNGDVDCANNNRCTFVTSSVGVSSRLSALATSDVEVGDGNRNLPPKQLATIVS